MKTVLYIAMSLDGFISREDGAIDWLDDTNQNTDYNGYDDFYRDVDTVVMGRKTYEKILTLSEEYPYIDKVSYVFTSKTDLEMRENVHTFGKSIGEFYGENKNKNIWVVGGGELVEEFIKQDRIDYYHIFIIPKIIGKGIKLFRSTDIKNDLKLDLEKVKSYRDGMVELVYKKR